MKNVCAPAERCASSQRPFRRPPWCRERLIAEIDPVSMVHESHAESTDVNKIVERFQRTGILPSATRQAQFADVTALQNDLTTLIEQSRGNLNTLERFAADWRPEPLPDPDNPPITEVLTGATVAGSDGT